MFRPSPMQHVTVHVVREDAPMAALVLADCGVFNPESAQVFGDRLPELPGSGYRDLYASARNHLDKLLACCPEPPEIPPPTARRQVDEQELARLEEWLRAMWLECSQRQESLRRMERSEERR